MENSAEIVGGPPKDRNCKFCTSASAANLAVDSYVYFPIQGKVSLYALVTALSRQFHVHVGVAGKGYCRGWSTGRHTV